MNRPCLRWGQKVSKSIVPNYIFMIICLNVLIPEILHWLISMFWWQVVLTGHNELGNDGTICVTSCIHALVLNRHCFCSIADNVESHYIMLPIDMQNTHIMHCITFKCEIYDVFCECKLRPISHLCDCRAVLPCYHGIHCSELLKQIASSKNDVIFPQWASYLISLSQGMIMEMGSSLQSIPKKHHQMQYHIEYGS